MKWLTRESFSERRWSGWAAWLKQVWVFSVAAGFVSELVLARDTQAIFDTLSVVLLWPLLGVCTGLLLALACVRLWKVSLPAALAYLATLLPCVFIIPLVQLLEGEILGVHDRLSFVGLGRAVVSLFTGGMLPVPVAPLGAALLWLVLCVWIGWSWWKAASTRTPRELAEAFAPSYIGFASLWLIPSFLGWLALFGHVSLWQAGADMVERGFITTQIDGFAWTNVYERFPFAIGGEAHISSQWLFATSIILVLLGLSFTHLSREWYWSWQRWWQFAEADRVKRVGGLVALGFLLACLFLTRPLLGWTHVMAFLELVAATGLFILARAGDIDLAKAAFGSLPHDRPLSLGLVRSGDLLEAKGLWRITGYILAGLLGWPVLVSFGLADLAHHMSMNVRGSLAYLAWNTASLAGFFLVGWMVVAERGSFGGLAPAFAALICLVYFAWNWLRPNP